MYSEYTTKEIYPYTPITDSRDLFLYKLPRDCIDEVARLKHVARYIKLRRRATVVSLRYLSAKDIVVLTIALWRKVAAASHRCV